MHTATELHGAWMGAMRRGDFAAAHEISDLVRVHVPAPPAHLTPRHLQRIWTGAPIDDRRVLVRCHHGLGDTIQFARFLPQLATRARTLLVYAQAPLLPLLQTMDMQGDVSWHAITDAEPSGERDLDVEIMELLHLLRVMPDQLSPRMPYLRVPSLPRARHEFSVGVVWSVGTWAPHRSLAVTHLAPLLALPGVHWHSLQHVTSGVQIDSHPMLPVRAPRPVWCTARDMRALDLVISVDSMPAHLAGALGIPVWTLLPHEADWRWMDDRADSPWYPTMRLFRQPEPGDWHSVVARVRSALEGWHGEHGE